MFFRMMFCMSYASSTSLFTSHSTLYPSSSLSPFPFHPFPSPPLPSLPLPSPPLPSPPSSSVVQQMILESPQGISRLMDIIADSREVIRNDVSRAQRLCALVFCKPHVLWSVADNLLKYMYARTLPSVLCV